MSVAENEPGPRRSSGGELADELVVAPLAAGNLPLNRPVAAIDRGRQGVMLTVIRAAWIVGVNVAALCEVARRLATGDDRLGHRGDSRLLGPTGTC